MSSLTCLLQASMLLLLAVVQITAKNLSYVALK
jgi:hypothetical protein